MYETVRADPGMNIHQFCQRLVSKAQDYNEKVQGVFNDIKLIVRPNSSVDDICTIYHLECELRRTRR